MAPSVICGSKPRQPKPEAPDLPTAASQLCGGQGPGIEIIQGSPPLSITASWLDKWLARRLLRAIGSPPISIVLCNGEEVRWGASPPVARVLFRDRGTLWRLAVHRDVQFGDAFTDRRIEIDGNLMDFLEAIYRARPRLGRWGRATQRLWRSSPNSLAGSRANIHHHYDIGDDFYTLWLDEEMLYTCAYFPTREVSLEQAQRAKMDYVCRKLRLHPGESVVEAGCGWGALARHMARHYGVRVKAFNISHAQIGYARRRAKEEGLDAQVEYIEDDYRNISGRFDVFVSVGMLEHVGRSHYRDLGRVIDRALGPAGRGLIHSIGQDEPIEISRWIRRRIFPGAYPPTVREMVAILEPQAFSVLDVENLRLHYALTLRHWLDRFDAAADTVRRMFDERFVRAWRLYLAGSTAAFLTGGLQLFQVVFTRHGVNEIPWTRAGLYE